MDVLIFSATTGITDAAKSINKNIENEKVSIFEVERIRKGKNKGLNITLKEDKKSILSVKDLIDSGKYVNIILKTKQEDDES